MSSKVFIFRSSHRRCSVRIGVLRSFAKFTGKHLCQSLLKPGTLLKKGLWHRCFPVNFAIFLRTLFLQTTSGRLLLHFIVFMNFSVNSYQHVHAKTSHVWKSRKVMMTIMVFVISYCINMYYQRKGRRSGNNQNQLLPVLGIAARELQLCIWRDTFQTFHYM